MEGKFHDKLKTKIHMKYVITLSVLLLLGAGCTQPESKSADTSAPEITEETTMKSLEQAETARTLANQKDLAAEYNAAILHTNLGDITVAFYADESPKTVNNFLNLAEAGEYNGTKFHRVIKDFMIQGGDPLSKDDSKQAMWGTGGPDYRFEDEFNDKPLVRGSLAMANAGPNTNGSQFFIVTAPQTPWLDGKHTNFGYVYDSMNVVEKIEGAQTAPGDRPLENIIVESVELGNLKSEV